ncbi:hypothetical protein GFC01_11840 [Desulfofundulus thermobenzoicus]|uniref:Uncharacterized protein n=1 Tax=Desulfofundulus thermobenzoicus TaxID=29376 RepID=A0A6N7IUY3_9FIRM|nr:hypothetical protein [Desulfofundulus thermobenzoicus]MQL52938.1 hypothetical protein [Desulfofundulus thermobenzoicus]
MGKKGLKSRIKSLEKRIKEHQEKIIAEKAKTYPNEGLISHWDKEIKAFQKSIESAKKRMGG